MTVDLRHVDGTDPRFTEAFLEDGPGRRGRNCRFNARDRVACRADQCRGRRGAGARAPVIREGSITISILRRASGGRFPAIGHGRDARETFSRDTIGASFLGRVRNIHAGIGKIVVIDGGKVWIVNNRQTLIEVLYHVCQLPVARSDGEISKQTYGNIPVRDPLLHRPRRALPGPRLGNGFGWHSPWNCHD